MPVLQEAIRFSNDMDALSDLERARLGQLVDKHQRTLYGYALRIGRSPDVADELVAEALFRVSRAFRRFRPRHTLDGDFLAWAKRIIHNIHINNYRQMMKRGRRAPMISLEYLQEEFGEDWGPTALDMADPSAEHQVLSRLPTEDEQAVLTDMDPGQSATFLLRMDGLTYREIADRLGVPIGTVRTRLHRARRRLIPTQRVP